MPSASFAANKQQSTHSQFANFQQIFKKVVSCQLSSIRRAQDDPEFTEVSVVRRRLWRQGFTFIELLIVITIFGLTASLITSAYLTFERNQRLKNAALDLKNQIRLAQNRALSGDKGPPAEVGACSQASTLVGWYIKLSSGNSNYRVSGDCLVGGNEEDFGERTFNLPHQVSISSVISADLACSSLSEANILFRPLEAGASFFPQMPSPPDKPPSLGFVNDQSKLNASCAGKLTIELSRGTNKYLVIIKPSGEVNEEKNGS